MIGVGFIGVGGMGMHQARAFAKARGCRIVAGSDLSPQSRDNFAKAYPDAVVFADHHELLAQPAVDAVVIAVPTLYHKPVAIDALRARKPVLVEKPMARTVADCKAMLAAARKYRTLLMVAHCRRFDPGWGTWKKYLESGRLGWPLLWRHAVAIPCPVARMWFMDDRVGGGPLIDGAVHNYDFANWMWGDPVRVVAQAIKLDRKVTATDTGTATVTYRNGCQLMVSWSWTHRGGRLFDVLGPQGTLEAGAGPLPRDKADVKKRDCWCVTDAKGKMRHIHGPYSGLTMYINQANHFLQCVRGKARCLSGGDEAIKAVAVAEAILKAGAGHGCRPVRW